VGMSKLRCVNCRTEVDPDKAKVCFGVLVCESCDRVANRFFEQAQKELKVVLVLMKDAIRMGLTQGRLQFSMDGEEIVTRQKLLAKLGELVERAQENAAQCSTKTTTSAETTKPSAPTVVGPSSSENPTR
jgi:hypothetical protein